MGYFCLKGATEMYRVVTWTFIKPSNKIDKNIWQPSYINIPITIQIYISQILVFPCSERGPTEVIITKDPAFFLHL